MATRLSKNDHEKRLNEVCQRVGRGMRYQTIANELKLDKNQIYKAFQDLLKSGRVKKVGAGAYQLSDGLPVTIAPRIYKKRKGNGADHPLPTRTFSEILIPPEPVSAPTKAIENLATELMGRIGALQPVLLLHKDLFAAIEKNTLELIEAIIDVKPRILTKEEMEEHRELKHIKNRAEKIAKARNYHQPDQPRRAR